MQVGEWVVVDRRGEQVPCELRLARLPSAGAGLLSMSVLDIRNRRAAEARRIVTERMHEILEIQFARALDISHPQGHAAAVDLLNRIMPPVHRQELTGADGSPTRFVISAQPEMTAEEWCATYGPGG